MLAASLGARVEVRPGGPEGRVVVRDGRFVVQMREGASWRRQRFTLAHEVAHLLLFSADAEAGRLRAVPSSSEHDFRAVERLCSVGAAELLMPRNDLRMAVLSGIGSRRLLRELHDRYLVSWRSLFVQIAEAFEGLSTIVWSRSADAGNPYRIDRAFTRTRTDWLPSGLSERRLTPNPLPLAEADGFAAADQVTLDYRGLRLEGAILATSLRDAQQQVQELPLFAGHVVPDEPAVGEIVTLFARSSATATYELFAAAATGSDAALPDSPDSSTDASANLTLW